jgi:hypothetical protein
MISRPGLPPGLFLPEKPFFSRIRHNLPEKHLLFIAFLLDYKI